MARPFDGLQPAPDARHAEWVAAALDGKEGVVRVVPGGYEAYARLLHPLAEGRPWADAAPAYLAGGSEAYPYPFPAPVAQVEGDPGPALIDALAPVLAASTATPQRCHYGLWVGWGELSAGSVAPLSARSRSIAGRWQAAREAGRARRTPGTPTGALAAFVAACPVLPGWGGRDLLLFDGPAEGVASVGWAAPGDGRLRRRGPQWWWPDDRRWFVATEIDFPWTYLAGPAALVGEVVASPAFEAVRLEEPGRW